MKKLFLVLVLVGNMLIAYSLKHDENNEQKRFYRHIYIKLPLSSVEYHWEFLDRKQFLKSNLTLIFTSEGKTVKEKIFSNGKLNSNWEVISDNDLKDKKNNIIYFGFVSKKRYWLNKNDSAKITLNAYSSLKGWGPYFKAILPKGRYVSHSKFFTIFEDDLADSPKDLTLMNAYITLENWKNLWTLEKKTKNGTGWMHK